MTGYITIPEATGRRTLTCRFADVLAEASRYRRQREDIVPGLFGPEPGWVAFERRQMRDAVNAERASRGLPPVPERDIYRAERMACGHSDYARQFAFSCSELAMGLEAAP